MCVNGLLLDVAWRAREGRGGGRVKRVSLCRVEEQKEELRDTPAIVFIPLMRVSQGFSGPKTGLVICS